MIHPMIIGYGLIMKICPNHNNHPKYPSLMGNPSISWAFPQQLCEMTRSFRHFRHGLIDDRPGAAQRAEERRSLERLFNNVVSRQHQKWMVSWKIYL